MKLIAKKHFSNVRELNLTIPTDSRGFQHELHIQKGFRFEVGKTEIYADLTASEKKTVGDLLSSRSVLLDNAENKAVVAKLDAEVDKELSVAEKASAPQAATVADILKALPGMIAAAVKANK